MSQAVIIQLLTMEDFAAEVATGSVVRLSLIEYLEHCRPLPVLHVNLDLQALNSQGQIVWLNDSWRLTKSPRGDSFWDPYGMSIYTEVSNMKGLVDEHLTKLGYEVRPGRFGLASDIKPVRGDFGCVDWKKVNDKTYTVERSEYHACYVNGNSNNSQV